MSTKGEVVINPQNSVNVVYGCPLRCVLTRYSVWLPKTEAKNYIFLMLSIFYVLSYKKWTLLCTCTFAFVAYKFFVANRLVRFHLWQRTWRGGSIAVTLFSATIVIQTLLSKMTRVFFRNCWIFLNKNVKKIVEMIKIK